MAWTRRRFLRAAGAGAALVGSLRPAPARAAKPITVAHSVSTFLYGQHLAAKEKKFFEDEGLSLSAFIAPGGGAKVAQAVAAGHAMFALGDASHSMKITEKGKDALILFATDTRCSYANIVVRKELFERGVKSVESLADSKLVGRKAVVAATAIGSGTYVYGVYVLKRAKAPDGKSVHEHVEWVSGGGPTTMLGGLKTGKFDAIMAVPDWEWAAHDEGFGRTIYDVLDEKAWTRVFGGPIPATVGFALRETVEKSPELVQGYVNACYRAQQWIRRAKDEEIVELLYKPYMETYSRENVLRSVKYYKTIFDWDFILDEASYTNGMNVWVPLALEKPVPYAKAVDMTFAKKARAKLKS
jgi:NitT/TauT family transport system substrate-binding protein